MRSQERHHSPIEEQELGLPVETQKQIFDYDTFRERQAELIAQHFSQFSLTRERILSSIRETFGQREKESKPKIVQINDQQRILFENEDGQILDPYESWLKETSDSGPPEIIVREGEPSPEFGAASSPTNSIECPSYWVNGKHPHQGIKLLHELAHLRVAQENWGRKHHLDELRLQAQLAFWFHFIPEMPRGEIIQSLNDMVDAGVVSNLGFKDREQREDYLVSMVDKVEKIAQQGEPYLEQFLKETNFDVHTLSVQYERDVWAKTLHMLREARDRGFVIDNRPVREIFDDIDLSLSTRVQPWSTQAVKRPAYREKLGLPNEIEERPPVDALRLEKNNEAIRRAKEQARKISQELRDFLHLHDESIRAESITRTPVTQIDSRVMRPVKWTLGSAEGVEIDRDMEAQVRLCCLALEMWVSEFERQHLKKYGKVMNSEELKRWRRSGPMEIIDQIGVSRIPVTQGERISLAFRTVNNGQGRRPERIDSN